MQPRKWFLFPDAHLRAKRVWNAAKDAKARGLRALLPGCSRQAAAGKLPSPRTPSNSLQRAEHLRGIRQVSVCRARLQTAWIGVCLRHGLQSSQASITVQPKIHESQGTAACMQVNMSWKSISLQLEPCTISHKHTRIAELPYDRRTPDCQQHTAKSQT